MALTKTPKYALVIPEDNCYGVPVRSNESGRDWQPRYNGVIGLLQRDVSNRDHTIHRNNNTLIENITYLGT